MFHKNAASSLRSQIDRTFQPTAASTAGGNSPESQHRPGPQLVSPAAAGRRTAPALPELIAIASRRCSSFFAEAAVLVLVFGILDFFLQRGRMELGWVAGALVISVGLLAASVATDFGAGRWLGAHP